MILRFIDPIGIAYTFKFDKKDLIVYSSNKSMAMPVEQVVDNTAPWKFLKNYFSMHHLACEYIERVCKNKAFL